MNPDKEIIRTHRQLSQFSCIPMVIELVLKLIGRVPPDYFEVQKSWKDNKLGTFPDFHEREIKGVKFQHKFSVDKGRGFPPEKMKELFKTIDHELDNGRYVMISIANPPGEGWHNFVIHDRNARGEYDAVSKIFKPNLTVRDGSDTWIRSDIRKRVTEMTGTDILTYDVLR